MNDSVKIPKRWRGRRWSALAESVRARNPICERCKECFSEEVHHTVPLHMGGSIFDPRNLVALCKACHNEVSNRIISQIKAARYSPNNDVPENLVISPKQRPFFANNEGIPEAPFDRDTTPKGQGKIYQNPTQKRESLGVRTKWQARKIK